MFRQAQQSCRLEAGSTAPSPGMEARALCSWPFVLASLSAPDALVLTQLGHYDPDLSHTCDLPPSMVQHHPQLRDYLSRVEKRVTGKALSDLYLWKSLQVLEALLPPFAKQVCRDPWVLTISRPQTPSVPCACWI